MVLLSPGTYEIIRACMLVDSFVPIGPRSLQVDPQMREMM
jgi:hypothetical protein